MTQTSRWPPRRVRRLIVVALSLTSLGLATRWLAPTDGELDLSGLPTSGAGSVSILTANVGNLSLECGAVLNKLCRQDVERRLAANIRLLSPDIVALQEVFADWQCEGGLRDNLRHLCASHAGDGPIGQVRRLVGDGYTISCAQRNQFECVALKVTAGTIEDCDTGAMCDSAVSDIPLEGCDSGFAIMAAKAQIHGVGVTIVNAHPQSTSETCRSQAIRQIFESTHGRTPLAGGGNAIVLGDFNLDPWRDSGISVQVWREYVGERDARPFWYLQDDLPPGAPMPVTHRLVLPRTVDLVVANFISGSCVVLGESAGTSRLDGGSGTDHRAVYCVADMPTVAEEDVADVE